MATATLESFKAELERLVSRFRENFKSYKNLYGNYKEAEVRLEFLDPFFKALGWDVEYKTGKKDVVVEYPVKESGGHTKSLDYLFRPEGFKPFTCEAKKPIEELDDHAWQAKRYAFCLPTDIATLTDFEEFYIYVVNAPPKKDKPAHQLAQKWHYTNYVECAKELWDLFSKEEVEKGSLEHFVRRKIGAKPVRTQTVDEVFLKELEKSRLNFGKNIFKNNGRKDVFEDNQLNENTQRILDRILFLRICEARGIDTGQTLESICDKSRHSPTSGTSAYAELAKHFQKLGKPTSGVPYFNGNIFSKHPSEDLIIDNHVLLEFIDNLSAETSPYLFEILPIEILGSIYEQFLGKELIAKGSGVAVDQKKTTVKKDTGVYYTPRYIVDYIVEQTLGKQLSEIANGNGQRPSLKDFEKQTSVLKVLDPACGSGSFLIRAFERICEHWERRLEDDLPLKDAPNRAAWEKEHRTRCYIDPQRDAVFLTVGLKKKILLDNIFGVDIDSAAVEVTQLSLYLKMLEHETKTTLGKQKDLFPSDIAVLPALKDNIKCGNSLISSDFSKVAEDLTRVNAFDWPIQFESIMKDGGFDTVIGNPPYLNIDKTWGKGDIQLEAIKLQYPHIYNDKTDLLFYFIAKALKLSKNQVGFIVSRAFLEAYKADKLRGFIAENKVISQIVDFQNFYVFDGVGITSCILQLEKNPATENFAVYKLLADKLPSQDLPKLLSDKETFEKYSVTRTSLTSAVWTFAPPELEALHSKIDLCGKPLGRILHIGQGMQTGCNEVFGERTRAEMQAWKVPEKLFRFRASNSDIQRFEIRDRGEVLLWVEDSDSFEILPAELRKHLDGCSNKLKARAAYKRGNCDWWRFTWPLHRDFYSQARLVSPFLATKNRFALVEDGKFIGLTDTIALFDNSQPESLKYLLALLNSRLLTLRYRSIGKMKGGGIYEYFWNSVSKLSIRRINFSNPSEKSRHDELVQFVDNMLDLTPKMRTAKSETDKATLQNAITATDNKIDRLVYDLYGLTEDEIKLVEESSANNK